MIMHETFYYYIYLHKKSYIMNIIHIWKQDQYFIINNPVDITQVAMIYSVIAYTNQLKSMTSK